MTPDMDAVKFVRNDTQGHLRYPASHFIAVDLPREAEQALAAARKRSAA